MTHSARAAGTGTGGEFRSDPRPLFVVAFVPSLLTLGILLVASAIVLLTSSTELGAVVPVVAGMWLAVHQVPVTVSDITLGVLPLVPTLALVALVARTVARVGAGRGLDGLRSVLLCAVAGPAFFTAVAIAVVNDAAGRYTVGTPPPLTAFLCTIGVHLGAALIGLAPTYFAAAVRRFGIPEWLVIGARIAKSTLLAFFAVGLIIVVVRLVWQWHTVLELVRGGNTAVGVIGLIVLSLLYLPNVAIAAAALPLGVDVNLGPITASIFHIEPGRAPGVPILAVLPHGDARWWLLALLAIPVIVAIRVGRRCASVSLDLGPTLACVGAAAVCTALGFTAAGFVASGELGGFGFAGVDLPRLALFTLGWIGVIGVLAALVLQQAGETRTVRSLRKQDAGAAVGGYTTYSDDSADPRDDANAAAVTEEFDPVVRAQVADEVEPNDDADSDEPLESDPDTGDFDALADEPTQEVAPARRTVRTSAASSASPRPERRRRPGADRDRHVAEIEELDSYTFGQ